MKPFNLEKAKDGYTIVTRDGHPARLLAWDLDNSEYALVVAVRTPLSSEETVHLYDKSGKYLARGEHPHDLFMAPVKKWRWAIARGRELTITRKHYASAEDIHKDSGGRWRVVQPICPQR